MGMLYLALSCLQGRPMAHAFDDLARLGTAIQLTPGNLPTPGFDDHVAASGVVTRRHHGFAFEARTTDAWSADGACLVDAESVHPPRTAAGDAWRAWYDRAPAPPVLEVMYPGYALGTGDEVERALDAGLPLAVDVSHVHIQRTQGAMTDRAWRRLAAYDRIAEVHVSANAGRHDSHAPLDAAAFGLAWVRERLAGGAPVVLECYMHRLTDAQRRAQVELVTGSVS
jgi:hypothetical protein